MSRRLGEATARDLIICSSMSTQLLRNFDDERRRCVNVYVMFERKDEIGRDNFMFCHNLLKKK